MSAIPQRKLSAYRPHPKARQSLRRPRRQIAQKSAGRPRRSSLTQRRQRGVALEMSILMGINVVIIAAASAAIIKLVPHQLAQREKLRVLQAELESLDHRVNELRQEFGHSFDPQRSLVNQRELNNHVIPGQRPVHLISPERHSSTGTDAASPPSR